MQFKLISKSKLRKKKRKNHWRFENERTFIYTYLYLNVFVFPLKYKRTKQGNMKYYLHYFFFLSTFLFIYFFFFLYFFLWRGEKILRNIEKKRKYRSIKHRKFRCTKIKTKIVYLRSSRIYQIHSHTYAHARGRVQAYIDIQRSNSEDS